MEDDPFQFFEIPFNDINEDNQSSPIVQENDSEDTPTQSNEDNEVGEREMEHHNIADEFKNLPITVSQISKKTAANQKRTHGETCNKEPQVKRNKNSVNKIPLIYIMQQEDI
ncbi:hypothetical protein V3C99_012289 [Haemonchus contortus]